MAKYSLGVDYRGQPFYETLYDRNENNVNIPPFLLTDSPYELNLSGSQRRDSWGMSTNSNLVGNTPRTAANTFVQSLSQNDDAPFSTTDLEKVLRGWDADAGTLPSRLWDVVDSFDPLKLMDYDPYRVQNIAQTAFGATTRPELLVAAQQIAGINRRLVTTESYSMPVTPKQMPAYIPELGADGAPGIFDTDDDPDGPGPLTTNGTKDDAAEIGAASPFPLAPTAPYPDDFQSLTGTKYSEGTIVDVMRYRFQRREIESNGRPYNLSDPSVKKKVDDIISSSTHELLPPEVVAGVKMDLNRPFGDGKDNNGDGVVDDPLEAGEPFLDANGNGKYDNGEKWLDMDGDGKYTFPVDTQLWAGGLVGEQMAFDYTNGRAEPIYNILYQPGFGVRNLESQGRQRYARQLYCLMLLLVDEGYIAPWDENDAQVNAWADALRAQLVAASLPAAEADLIVKRKLTCRSIAQWAINCVDMRDSDVIMTPFEYDENPWNGWGTGYELLPIPANFVPIDGDPATDENKGEIIDWAQVSQSPNPNTKKITKVPQLVLDLLKNDPRLQTRGVVWGAERPELLITETLAFHDRRTENLLSAESTGGHGQVEKKSGPTTPPPGSQYYPDSDLDQGLRPQGSAFVELYNPWSDQGQYPAELYSRVDVSTGYKPTFDTAGSVGVDLGRLSNLAWDDQNKRLTGAVTDSSLGIKRSPVWRMIVVEEWQGAKNTGDMLPVDPTNAQCCTAAGLQPACRIQNQCSQATK